MEGKAASVGNRRHGGEGRGGPVSEKMPIDRLLDTVEWRECEGELPVADDGLPYATHKGILWIGGYPLECYQLSTGQRVFEAESVHRFFDGEEGAARCTE